MRESCFGFIVCWEEREEGLNCRVKSQSEASSRLDKNWEHFSLKILDINKTHSKQRKFRIYRESFYSFLKTNLRKVSEKDNLDTNSKFWKDLQVLVSTERMTGRRAGSVIVILVCAFQYSVSKECVEEFLETVSNQQQVECRQDTDMQRLECCRQTLPSSLKMIHQSMRRKKCTL